MNRFYYHGITDNALVCLESILNAGAILSRSLMNDKQLEISNHEYIGYNGYNYISVCKKYYNSELSDCYDEYIRNNISLVIINPTNLSNTQLIHSNDKDSNNYQDYYNNYHNCNARYSDLTGEFQVYEKIPLKNIVAISYPLTMLINDIENSYMSNEEKITNYRKTILDYYHLNELLKKYKINKPIIDLENWKLVNDNLDKVKHQLIKH